MVILMERLCFYKMELKCNMKRALQSLHLSAGIHVYIQHNTTNSTMVGKDGVFFLKEIYL